VLTISQLLVKWALIILMFTGSNVHASEPLPLSNDNQLQFSQILQPAKSALPSARTEPRAIHKVAPDQVPPPSVSKGVFLLTPSYSNVAKNRLARVTSQRSSAEFPFLPPSHGPPSA